jgi:hypothetical protein
MSSIRGSSTTLYEDVDLSKTTAIDDVGKNEFLPLRKRDEDDAPRGLLGEEGYAIRARRAKPHAIVAVTMTTLHTTILHTFSTVDNNRFSFDGLSDSSLASIYTLVDVV